MILRNKSEVIINLLAIRDTLFIMANHMNVAL